MSYKSEKMSFPRLRAGVWCPTDVASTSPLPSQSVRLSLFGKSHMHHIGSMDRSTANQPSGLRRGTLSGTLEVLSTATHALRQG